MKISGNSPNNNNRRVENKGDVSRELLETSELTNLLVPRLLRDNQRNGAKKGQKSHSSLKGRVQMNPPAGNGSLAAQSVFR